MSQRWVYFNDRFLPESEARVPFYDSALIAGEAVFEVTRTFRQQPFRLREHLQRLAGSMEVLRIDCGYSLEELERLTLETLARNLPSDAQDMEWQVIHNISRGPAPGYHYAMPRDQWRPTVIISCFPLIERAARLAPLYETGVDLVVPMQKAVPPELLPTHVKTRGRLHYLIAGLQTSEAHPGCWPVLVDSQGHLTEGTAYNFFLISDGVLSTSPEEDVLIGITRSVVLDLAAKLRIPVREEKLTLTMACFAEELFVTATSFGILHARSFEGHKVQDGQIGPLTRRLQSAFQEEVGVDFAAQSVHFAEQLEPWRARQYPLAGEKFRPE